MFFLVGKERLFKFMNAYAIVCKFKGILDRTPIKL